MDTLVDSIKGEEAVASLAAVTDFRFALLLREFERGWSLERIETWMAATSRTLLLGAHNEPQETHDDSATA